MFLSQGAKLFGFYVNLHGAISLHFIHFQHTLNIRCIIIVSVLTILQHFLHWHVQVNLPHSSSAHSCMLSCTPIHTCAHTLRCQGLLSLCLTLCYLQNRCRVSLLQPWDPVRMKNLFYMVECTLWFPIQHRDF